MTMRHLALTTALTGLVLAGLVSGPAAYGQSRADAMLDSNRQFENPAGPASMPSPTDDTSVLPGRGGTIAQSDIRDDRRNDVLSGRRIEAPADSAEEHPADIVESGADAVDGTVPVIGETSPVITSADARDLIGAELKSADDETVGKVESVYLDPQGEVRSVIVGVGGFMGLGERKVALGWTALNVADDGRTVYAALTREQLKDMPEYRYADAAHRGQVFSDSGVVTN